MAKYKVRFNRNFNIGRTVSKIGMTVLALWIGGFFLTELGTAMLGSCSPFYKGLTIIGWKVGNSATANATFSPSGNVTCVDCVTTVTNTCARSNLILYDISNAGILTVVGLIGIASIVMEFVDVRMG